MKFLKWLSVLLMCALVGASSVSAQESKKINILLLGSDAGYEEDRVEELAGSRSDGIMIATIDTEQNKLTLSTIPRDSLVDIPGYGYDKVNHAFAFGGKELTIQTLEQWLGIEFDHYVVSNMPGFVQLINTFGGVDVVPPATFNWWEKFFFEKDKPQKLDGDHALAYARERATSGGDYARQARMREMVTVIVKKLIADGSIEHYRQLFEERYEYILTDLTFDQITELYSQLNDQTTIEEYQLSGDGTTDEQLGYIDHIHEESLNELREIIQ